MKTAVVVVLSGIWWTLLLLGEMCSGNSVLLVDMSKNWTLHNQNQSIQKTHIQLPSGVYSAISGEDVLQSYNDINLRWISYDNWTYIKEFSVDPTDPRELSLSGHVNLTFHGIDTVAEIRLNHYLLGRTDNMFLKYSFDVTNILERENILEVEIKSPVYAALERANALASQNITVPPNCPISRYQGECHMNMLRKMQASFSWDWGLAAPSMGIWKPVTLDRYEVAIISDIDVIISKNDTHWNTLNKVYINAVGKKNFYAELTLYAIGLSAKAILLSDYTRKRLNVNNPVIVFEQAYPIEKVVPWWPNGYGEQRLYPLHFTLNAWLDRKGPSIRSKTKSQKTIQIGFRTIELVEDPAPAGDGNTFLFKVNGVEMFMKGTNYIPAHILPELGQNPEKIKFLLNAAKEAHMNMIRVWGGGVYESDFFYEMADYYGLLIWQDMMFACAMYPVTPEFLTSVREEVRQNARRIAYHPSVAIFATNNENEAALVGNWYGTEQNRARFESEYRELYVANVIHELKTVQHDDRPEPLVSSPSNGKISAQSNFINKDPQSNFYGDIHFYLIFQNEWLPQNYPRPRFSSEFGFQSLPSYESWKRSMHPEDDISDLMNHRSHHMEGLKLIVASIHHNLPLPLPEEPNFLEAFIYFSQISQAMATKTQTELYRSLRDTDHRTMGALYWQLNDVWVAPSWSSIDFYGNYKLLQYYAKDFMAPIAITALYDKGLNALNVSLICDMLKTNRENLTVTMNHYLYSELFPRNTTKWPATLKLNGVHYDKVIPLSEILVGQFNAHNCFIEFVLQRGDSILAKNYYFPSPLQLTTGMADPEIQVEVDCMYCNLALETMPKVNAASIVITVTKPAIFLFIEVIHPDIVNYKLSRNGYMQTSPIQVVHVEFESSKCIQLKAKHIKVLTVNKFMLESPYAKKTL